MVDCVLGVAMTERVGTCQCGGAIIMPSNMVNETPHCEQCGNYVIIYQTRPPVDEEMSDMTTANDEWAV